MNKKKEKKCCNTTKAVYIPHLITRFFLQKIWFKKINKTNKNWEKTLLRPLVYNRSTKIEINFTKGTKFLKTIHLKIHKKKQQKHSPPNN